MRKDKMYFLTFLSISAIFMIMASIAIRYIEKASVSQMLETQLEYGKREAKELGSLINSQLAHGVDKEQLISAIQESIDNTNLETGFVSMFDWSGTHLCHPDIRQVGQALSQETSFVSSVADDLSTEEFYTLLKDRNLLKVTDSLESTSEVICMIPIQNSDWIVAAHANTQKIAAKANQLRTDLNTILLIMGLVVILSFIIVARLIGSSYEKRLELKNQQLEDEVINLSKLNRAVGDYQQKVSEQQPKVTKKDDQKSKRRILTYVRNELLPVATEEIAHIYTESNITYVVRIDGRRTTTNMSLDELFSNLDNSFFFRANRQFIIAISAIDKIVKYGNNQLKILVNPDSAVDIIISKNRASEFRQWLNL